MTNRNSQIEFARETCNTAHTEARRLQGEAGIALAHRCRKPAGFTAMGVEMLEKLTERYDAISTTVRAELEANKVVETPVVEESMVEVIAESKPVVKIVAKPVVLSEGERLMAKIQEKAATEVARKMCVAAQMEAYSFQKRADVAQEKRCALPKGFKSLGQAEYEDLMVEYAWIAEEHRALAEQKAAIDAKAKAEADEQQLLAEKKVASARQALVTEYYAMLAESAHRLGVLTNAHPLFHKEANRVSDKNLRALIKILVEENLEIERVQLRAKHERQQKLLENYNNARRSGREGRSFNAWLENQGRGAMRRTG